MEAIMKQFRKRSLTGFTLIEVIVALTVFLIGIVSLFPFFSGGLKMLSDIEKKVTVANLARSQMTEIEAQGFDENVTDTPRTSFPNPYDNYEYEVKWTPIAYDVASSSEVSLFKVELIIYWTGRSGAKTDTFITYIGRMNPY